MAEKVVLLESLLSCHVCSETFRDPVSLSCNHSFCLRCLQRFWEQAGNKNCPICKRKSSKDDLGVNFQLKELADVFAERQKTGSNETERGEKKVEVVCCECGEETKLFCEDEQKAVCPVCESSLQQSHKLVPLEQAVRNLKDQLRSDLKSLQEKKNKHQQVKKTYNEVIQLSEKQLVSTERKIRAEFNKLHQFLREEEESRLTALREEEEQKEKTISREMKMIEEQISSLSDSISAVEEDLQKHKVSKELADVFAERQKTGSNETERGEKKVEVVCCECGEETKLFCEDEQKAVCPVCESSLQQSHKLVPLEQAVRNLKDQLRSDLKSLQDKRDTSEEVMETYNDMIELSKKQLVSTERNKHQQVKKTYNEVIQLSEKQLVSTERKIRAEFNKLHQFLREEEESRLTALREEEEQKEKTISREMKMIEEQISSLSDSISAVEEDLQKHKVSKELADVFAERQKTGSNETERGEKKVEVVCCECGEETKLFCEDEQKAVCPVCESSLQQSHKLVPLEQAVRNLKDQLRSDLKSLQDKRDTSEEVMETYNDMIELSKKQLVSTERNKHQQVKKTYNEVIQLSEKQLVSTERKIRAEFNKLHQFLREEEESRLTALREEEEQKEKTISREMKMIEEQISSLSDSISAVEEDLQKHKVSFLSSYKATQTRARVQSSLTDPQLVSGALIDVAKHLGNLSFRVWEKMKDLVHFSPVILDPNTANYSLSLSDDLTSVRRGDTKQQLPDNPERFTEFVNVLGSEGFSSGKHSWEVEVGDHPYWNLGLVKESVNRKGEIFVSPVDGVWCLVHRSGKYTDGVGQTVRVKKSLQRIRVQLDYDRGEVYFYDPEDMTHIYTHRDTFTEKLFPWFYIGYSGDAKTTEIKICPTDVSL